MKKISIIFEGDIYKHRGEFVAIRNRISELSKQCDVTLDVYIYFFYISDFANHFLHFNSGKRIDYTIIDGIKYNCIWVKKSWIDFFTRKLFKKSTSFELDRLDRALDLSSSDIIYAHSRLAGMVAYNYKKNYNIPFIVLWHGSSIHTSPFLDKTWYKQTKTVLTNSNFNLFVSDELQKISQTIVSNSSMVSLNGVDTKKYQPYDIEKKNQLKQFLNIPLENKVVAYIGNYMSVKNVEFLPVLFSEINREIPNTSFYLVGSKKLLDLFSNSSVTDIRCIDNISNDDMPDIYNIMDLIVLPSINEGLPMTCLEAKACGINFIASRVGGIADAIGIDNTVPRNESFNKNFIELCIKSLMAEKKSSGLDPKFNLSQIVKNEYTLMSQIIDGKL